MGYSGFSIMDHVGNPDKWYLDLLAFSISRTDYRDIYASCDLNGLCCIEAIMFNRESL